MSSRVKRMLSEGALWMTANLVTTSAALLATYLGVELIHGGGVILAGALAIAGVVSLTWGSWISLSWTRTVGLRAAMKGITLVPGLLFLAAAGTGFYIGLGSLFAWLALVASAVGTLAATVLLWKYMPRASAQRSRPTLALGFLIYPIGTSLAAGAIGWLWFWFVTDTVHTDWRALLSFATVMSTILAAELVTTVVPAALSMSCVRASALFER